MIINVNTSIPTRLDKYLKRLYPLLTQGVIEKALRHKLIIVNSQKVEAALRVVNGDEILISEKFNLPIAQPSNLVFTDAEMKLAKKIITEYLIYEDDNIIVINKPAGLATQGGSKINLSVDSALKYLNSQGGDFKLVHRLDKETSGLLLIAKNYESSVKLHNAFKEKLIIKTYLAVIYGRPDKDSGEVKTNIEKAKGSIPKITDIYSNDLENWTVKQEESKRSLYKIGEHASSPKFCRNNSSKQMSINGKLAITHYKLLKSLSNNLFLIEFNPVTGRMHQLRLHAKLLGCPIVGDNKYGSIEIMPYSKYMLLHASNIILSEAVFGKEIRIEANLPLYFSNKFLGVEL